MTFRMKVGNPRCPVCKGQTTQEMSATNVIFRCKNNCLLYKQQYLTWPA